MAKRSLATPAELRQLFDYNPKTGALTWRSRPEKSAAIFNGKFPGKAAGTPHADGGVIVKIHGQNLAAHRIIWAMVYECWPANIVHKNGRNHDNRLKNLASKSRVVIQRNLKNPKTNTSGVQGVRWNEQQQKWSAAIKVGRTQTHLGYFTNKDAAIAARTEAVRTRSRTGKV